MCISAIASVDTLKATISVDAVAAHTYTVTIIVTTANTLQLH